MSNTQTIRPDIPGKDLSLVVDPVGSTETGITIKGSGEHAGCIGLNNIDPKEQLDVKGKVKADEFIGIGASITGMVIAFAGDTPPDGWLICDGSEMFVDQYPALAKLLGAKYVPVLPPPAGKFLVPDLSNRSLRGVSPISTIGAEVGNKNVELVAREGDGNHLLFMAMNYIIKT